MVELGFVGLAIFVVVMFVKALLPRKMPGVGKLRDKLSPQLRDFIASLPLPDDHPLASSCVPWKPTKAPGYPKAFLPLWQDSEGNPSYYSTYIKLGSKPTFHGLAECENEQAFLGALVVTVMQPQFKSDQRKGLDLGRRAAEAVGFRYFDEASKFLSTWRPPAPEEDEKAEELEEEAPSVFADVIEEMEKQHR